MSRDRWRLGQHRFVCRHWRFLWAVAGIVRGRGVLFPAAHVGRFHSSLFSEGSAVTPTERIERALAPQEFEPVLAEQLWDWAVDFDRKGEIHNNAKLLRMAGNALVAREAALRKAVAALENIATGGGPADVGADAALAAIADLLENGGQ
jgi:hypothetical protein